MYGRQYIALVEVHRKQHEQLAERHILMREARQRQQRTRVYRPLLAQIGVLMVGLGERLQAREDLSHAPKRA
jgi:hypothetical protein